MSSLSSLWTQKRGGNESQRNAISPTRQEDFPQWYQQVIKEADLAENSGVRGCMVLKPDGYAIWEGIQGQFDALMKAAGVKNAAFPIFIPLEFFQREAQHAEGFATEVAVVTHKRLEKDANGILQPTSKLEEPLIVRPTSEMIIGDSMARWIQSHRDLPLRLNQWCSVVRMEMRTRLFLRTTEFWWQEGHSAHASALDAQNWVQQMFDLYHSFITNTLALPVVPGEKIESERFAGAERTYTIEAMMQDRKALQAATSHYLGQNFAKAMNIQFQNSEGTMEHAYTTSWGMSTRIVGGLIMAHSDDDGLRLPPRIAPLQVMILPVVPKDEVRGEVLEYAAKVKGAIQALSYNGRPITVQVDERDIRGGEKNWEAVKKGYPIRIELGPKDIAQGQVVVSRRDLPTGAKAFMSLEQLIELLPQILEEQQTNYSENGKRHLVEHTRTDVHSLDELKQLFSSNEEEEKGIQGAWVRAPWSGDASTLDALKELKLTVRCIPLDQSGETGSCILTGKPASREVIIAKAY